jgi:hypothetical protein
VQGYSAPAALHSNSRPISAAYLLPILCLGRKEARPGLAAPDAHRRRGHADAIGGCCQER